MADPLQPLPEDLAILCQHRRAFGPGPGSSLASRSEPGGAGLELPDSIGALQPSDRKGRRELS